MCIVFHQYNHQLLDTPAGNTLFDPHLNPIPRFALAMFFTFCSGIVVYMTIDAMYHFSTLIGHVQGNQHLLLCNHLHTLF
jgi:hypothetical protein